MIRLWFPTVLGFLLGVLPAQAHEMWLEPRGNDLSDYRVDLIVGQNFQGGAGVWIPPSVARAEWISGRTSRLSNPGTEMYPAFVCRMLKRVTL